MTQLWFFNYILDETQQKQPRTATVILIVVWKFKFSYLLYGYS